MMLPETIWKYEIPLQPAVVFELKMPGFAKVLSVQLQRDEPVLWALVNKRNPEEAREFVVMPTGIDFDASKLAYVGTWQDRGLVWHLFEVRR